jgi:DNA-binding transcriptional regulator YiaG
LAALPFCHRRLVQKKPKNNSYLWKAGVYPSNPRHIGERIKKRRFDLKVTTVECRKILRVDKSTLTNWKSGKRTPKPKHHSAITRLLGDNSPQEPVN